MDQSFRDLRVWQKAMNLILVVYSIASEFPKHKVYRLFPQMRHAAVSIAEGRTRTTRRDFRQFVIVAKNSVCELQTQLLLAERLRYMKSDALRDAELLSTDEAQMLSGLSAYPKGETKPQKTVSRSHADRRKRTT